MKYSPELADQIIATHQLVRTVRHNWEKAGTIPDIYSDSSYVKPEPLTDQQRTTQEALLEVIAHPIIFHSAFYPCIRFKGKLDEMLFLRRSKKDKDKKRKSRPSIPILNFSQEELTRISNQMEELSVAIKQALSQALLQPYDRRQETLKELLRSRPELTVRQTVAGLSKEEATRWINYLAGVRGPLPEQHRDTVAHVFSELQDLLILIQRALYYKPT